MCTLASSEDPDEMLHNAAFHQDLHCLPRQKRSSEKELQFNLEIIACDSLIYTMDHSKFIISNQMKNPLVHKGLKNRRNLKAMSHYNVFANVCRRMKNISSTLAYTET